MGENHFASAPTALYGVIRLMAAIAYRVLQQTVIVSEGPDSLLKKAVGRDWKGTISHTLYAAVANSSPALLWTLAGS